MAARRLRDEFVDLDDFVLEAGDPDDEPLLEPIDIEVPPMAAWRRLEQLREERSLRNCLREVYDE